MTLKQQQQSYSIRIKTEKKQQSVDAVDDDDGGGDDNDIACDTILPNINCKNSKWYWKQ